MKAACRIKIAIAVGTEIRLERPFRRRLALGPFELEVGDHAEFLEAWKVEGVNKLHLFFSTMSVAVSAKVPVGAPEASRPILPPGGLGVSAVMPVSSRPRLFTQPVCPSLPHSTSGLFASILSTSFAVAEKP